MQCSRISHYPRADEQVYTTTIISEAIPDDSSQFTKNEQFAKEDPIAFLHHCREQYFQNIQDYSCTFIKQERIKGRISEEQVMSVKYREEPYSVNMLWTVNPSDAVQVTYIAGRWKDKNGNEQAWCVPAGAIVKIFIKKTLQPIHGKRAEKASRRTLDQFGFRNTLDLIIRYSEVAAERNELDLKYTGAGKVFGRPTLVFERLLPETEKYPDRLLVFHIDREWLLPTACFSYADENSQRLLGKYILKDAQFNHDYQDIDFGPGTLGR